jgi:uncharacterized protein
VPRAVLDPNVLVAALLTPHGACAQLLAELAAGAFEIVTSPNLLDELDDALKRDKFRAYWTEAEASAYVEDLRGASIVVDDPGVGNHLVSSDPDDDYLIALAHSAGAVALVSGDKHLTQLRGKVPVFTPREFLDSLR